MHKRRRRRNEDNSVLVQKPTEFLKGPDRRHAAFHELLRPLSGPRQSKSFESGRDFKAERKKPKRRASSRLSSDAASPVIVMTR